VEDAVVAGIGGGPGAEAAIAGIGGQPDLAAAEARRIPHPARVRAGQQRNRIRATAGAREVVIDRLKIPALVQAGLLEMRQQFDEQRRILPRFIGMGNADRKAPAAFLERKAAQSNLFEVVGARRFVRTFAHFLHRRQQQADQAADDRHRHQQFDQCEAATHRDSLTPREVSVSPVFRRGTGLSPHPPVATATTSQPEAE
jgi:hypothetical protein